MQRTPSNERRAASFLIPGGWATASREARTGFGGSKFHRFGLRSDRRRPYCCLSKEDAQSSDELGHFRVESNGTLIFDAAS